MNLTTPESVQKLQTALHDKAKESPNFRFYALYDKVYRKDVLAFAYECCKANGGAAGVDGQTFEDVESYGAEPINHSRYGGYTYPSRTGNSGRWGYPLSATGQRKWQQFWYSNPSSRPICNQNSMPIGEIAARWTQ